MGILWKVALDPVVSHEKAKGRFRGSPLAEQPLRILLAVVPQ